MNGLSVSFSRPYFVNAPLVTDVNKSNAESVKHNVAWCNSLLDSLSSQTPSLFIEDHSLDYFRKWPHYFDVVRYHIDIPMIRNKIQGSVYYCVQDFVSDIELMWSNIILFFSTTPDDYALYTSKWSSCFSEIESRAKDVSTSFEICADHCIFCGATSYAKYPLIECNGKCGRKSHLHCGNILDGSWTCYACEGRSVVDEQKKRNVINMLCSFKEWASKQ